MRRTKKKKCPLTYAAKRYILTMASVMSIKIPFNGQYIECSTPGEASEVLKHLEAESKKKLETGNLSIFDMMNPVGTLSKLITESKTSAWTRESFWKLIENVGDAQKLVLDVLVRSRRATDEELRNKLKLDSNQALAGVLSGISKQAGILNVPARSVYIVEDERKDGELTKTYVVANDFLRMTTEMNWP